MTALSSEASTARDVPPAFLVLDTESVPDGKLLGKVKYSDQTLSDEEAIRLAQAEARDRSATGSDFLPVTFQYPIAVCILRVGKDFLLQRITCLDAPLFRPPEIVRQFWEGLAKLSKARLVTFNGRGFDLPLMELAAFRYGCSGQSYFQTSRNRFGGNHIDLLDWLSNYGGCRLAGGLNLLSKLLGNPGKMEIAGDQVYEMYTQGKTQEINDYCLCDTLDTYFVFLRTRVLTGELTLEKEAELVRQTKTWLETKVPEWPVLTQYLANWGDWKPWP
jgi:hypothetical protein